MDGNNPEIAELPIWKVAFKNWYKLPWLETISLCVCALFVYVGWLLISLGIETPPGVKMSAFGVYAWVSGLFFISLGIGFLATLCGIGGGVLWSPIAMAFTPMNSVIIRASGLIVAMFNGLVATGPLMRTGLCNLRIVLFSLIAYGVGAFSGAKGAIYVARAFGPKGEGVIRIVLGLIVLFICFYFIFGGKKTEYPDVKKTDRFTGFFNIPLPYYEESLGKVLEYKLTRAWLLMIAIATVGCVGGFFGMGGGWALVPAMNAIMGAPLKVAAAASMTMLGMGDCVAVWPYFKAGAMIPIVIAPLLVGQVLGGLLGSYVLIGMRATFVRFILIGVLLFSSFGLITKGTALLEWLVLPTWVRLCFGLVCGGVVFYLMAADFNWLGLGKKEGR